MDLRDRDWSFNAHRRIGPVTPAQRQGFGKDTDSKPLIQGSGKETQLWAKRELPMSNQTSKHFPYAVEESKFILFA